MFSAVPRLLKASPLSLAQVVKYRKFKHSVAPASFDEREFILQSEFAELKNRFAELKALVSDFQETVDTPPLVLNAGLGTFSITYLLMAVRNNAALYQSTITELHAQRWINSTQVPGLPLPALSNMDVLRYVSYLMKPLSVLEQQKMSSNPSSTHSRGLGSIMGQVLSPGEAQRLEKAMLLARPGWQVRTDHNLNEVRLSRCLAAARSQLAMEKDKQLSPDAQWQELLRLWEAIEGQGDLSSSSRSPSELEIILYSSSCSYSNLHPKHNSFL
ncbi:hypothetical protein DFH06DRAFT_1476806 [Mycena polygramma]|nr:hypothetical protein DFH06DRAFT_1476806 [Mycena polygramma]